MTDKIKNQVSSKSILNKYPDRKPIIIYDVENKINHKFLLFDYHTVSILILTLKKRMNINNVESIYLFTENKTLPDTSSTIDRLYNEYKNEDGYLYLEARKENTFG